MATKKRMKHITVITEGTFDAAVLKKLFQNNSPGRKIEIISASGYSSALSKVKSLITLQHDNILLVLDTDTTDEIEIKQKEDFVKSYINTGSHKIHFKIFWAIPEFEIIFLNNKKFVDELANRKLSKEMLILAKNAPRKLLETISNKKRESFIDILDNKEIREDFFKEGLIKDISDYIAEKQESI